MSPEVSVGTKPRCHICGGVAITFFCEKNSYKIYRCSSCDLRFVFPMPTDLAAIYGEDYFKNESPAQSHGYGDYDRDKEPMRNAFIDVLKYVEKLVTGRRIFDVGAATGYFLDLAHVRGWQTFGSEISAYGAKEAQSRGHEMVYGDLPTLSQLPAVDVVTMFDVLEHVADPRAFVTAINRMLPLGGIFVINTPDASSTWARFLGPRWQLIVPPEHVYYYSPNNVRMLLLECGFETVEISRMSKRFTLPYIFKMLASWQGLWIWKILGRATSMPLLRTLKVPADVRDNMLVIARKSHDA